MKSKKEGLYWANVWLTSINQGKCVIAVDEGENWYLMSNSSLMLNDSEWDKIKGREGWYYREVKKSDNLVTIFK